jgi:hypothetical protein
MAFVGMAPFGSLLAGVHGARHRRAVDGDRQRRGRPAGRGVVLDPLAGPSIASGNPAADWDAAHLWSRATNEHGHILPPGNLKFPDFLLSRLP